MKARSAKEGYRFVEHTADVEYIASGMDAESCFSNALMAMFDTISYTKKVSSSRSKSVTIAVKDKAKNIEDLLWYALQDTLSISESKALFAYAIKNIKIVEGKSGYSIKLQIYAKQKEDRMSKLDVKGVSRYNLGVKVTKKGMKATVVLDV
jgi:SHS2 domain-containing protein